MTTCCESLIVLCFISNANYSVFLLLQLFSISHAIYSVFLLLQLFRISLAATIQYFSCHLFSISLATSIQYFLCCIYSVFLSVHLFSISHAIYRPVLLCPALSSVLISWVAVTASPLPQNTYTHTLNSVGQKEETFIQYLESIDKVTYIVTIYM